MTCAQGYITACEICDLPLSTSLFIPQFLFGDVLFRMVDSTGLHKLGVAFNNCVRFVYGLRRYDHVSEYSRNILGCVGESTLLV
jgi:hypothetical protein